MESLMLIQQMLNSSHNNSFWCAEIGGIMKKTRLEMKFTALLMVGIVALQGPGQIVAAEEIFSDDSIALSAEEDFLWNEVEEEGDSEEGEQDGEEAGGLISDNADVSEQFELIEDIETQTESYTEYTQDTDEYQFTTDERYFVTSDIDNEPDSENSIEDETTSYGIETVDEASLSTIEEEFVIEEELALDDQTVDPVSSGVFEGHRYAVYDHSLTWDEAEAFCEALGGHLVTINSAEEQMYVEGLASSGSKYQYWLGACRELSGSFSWVTGESFSYTNWSKGQPDNHAGENYVQMLKVSNPNYAGAPYTWNDIRRDNWFSSGESGYFSLQNIGLICEWDRDISIKLEKEYTGVYEEEFCVSASVTSYSSAPSSSNFKWEINLNDDKVEWGSMSVITVKEGEYIVSSPVTVKDAGKFEITAEFEKESTKSVLKVKPSKIHNLKLTSNYARELIAEFENHPCADGYIIQCNYDNCDEQYTKTITISSPKIDIGSVFSLITLANGEKECMYHTKSMPRADYANIKVCAFANVNQEDPIEGDYSEIKRIATGNQILPDEMWSFKNPNVTYSFNDYRYFFAPEPALEWYADAKEDTSFGADEVSGMSKDEREELIRGIFYEHYQARLNTHNTMDAYRHTTGVCYGMVEAAIAAYYYASPDNGLFGTENLYNIPGIEEACYYKTTPLGLSAEQ